MDKKKKNNNNNNEARAMEESHTRAILVNRDILIVSLSSESL